MRRYLVTVLAAAALSLWALPLAAAQELPQEIPDPAGDTIDFNGDPSDGPDIIGATAVEVTDLDGRDAMEAFDRIFGLGDDPDAVTILPEEPGPLLGGDGPLVMVKMRLAEPLASSGFCQIVLAFRTQGNDPYSGPAGDPNTGNDTSLDLFRTDSLWMTGRTEFRSGQFTFQEDYSEIAAAITDDEILIIFPRDAVPDGLEWQIWVICGGNQVTAGRDFVDIGTFPPGAISAPPVGGPTSTTTSSTTTTTTSTTTTTRAPTTTLIPATTTLAPSTEGGGGGGLTILIITGVIIVIVGTGVFVLRKGKKPCDCDEERAAYDAALDAWQQAQHGSQAAREDADGAVSRHNRAINDLFSLYHLRPRRGEYSDQASFDAANADYEARSAELEGNIEILEADIEAAEARAADAENITEQRFQEARVVHGYYSACVQRCFGSTVTRPPGSEDDGGTKPGETPGGGPPGGYAPPPEESAPSECTEPASREIEGPVKRFTVPVNGNVRVSLGTDRGPVDDLEDIVTGSDMADTLTDLLGVDGSLELSADSISGAGAGAWENTITELGSLVYGVVRREVIVTIAYEVEDVALVCVTRQECSGGKWVTVGKRLDEQGRTQRTVTATWESISSDRPLGATFTSVRNGLARAEESASQMRAFSSGCQ